MWKRFRSHAIAISAHHTQADGQIKRINYTIGQIFCAYLWGNDQKHWPNYVAVIEMDINSTNIASVSKAPFEVFYGESIPLPIDLLFSREASISTHAYIFARNTK